MSILIQLKLLLWKNVLLRKRQKLRCFKELFWPLSLFLLLMWVRSKGFREVVHQCYFEDKPLPSAGTLLYYQGLVCTINNTCHEFYHNAHRNYSAVDSSRFYEFYDRINNFVQQSSPWNKNIFVDFAKDLQDLVDKIEIFNSIQNDSTIFSYLNNAYLEMELQNLITIQQNLETQTNNMEKILSFIKILENIDKSTEEVSQMTNESNKLDESFIKLHSFMCGNESTSLNLTMLLQQKKKEESLVKYLLKNEVIIPGIYKYDPAFSRVCNKIYKQLETSKSLYLLWNKIKPFARGKVIFSPNTTHVTRIINRLKEIMTVPELPKLEFDDYTLEMNITLYNKTKDNLSYLKTFISNFQIRSDGYKIITLIKNNLEKTIIEAEHYSDLLYKLFQLLEKLRKEVFPTGRISSSEILKCYTSVTFEGYDTEEEAEKRSYHLCDKNELLAQISFLNINESSGLLPVTSYKIRMNNERLPKNLNKYNYFGGPNSDPFQDLQLLSYGFVYIQDMVEKSIISELTGRTDTPGYILKQFPYPCHVDDSFMTPVGDIFPLFMVLSWVYTTSVIIKNIVHEKEVKLKETMRILGLNNFIHWCSWFIDSFIPMTITACILAVILVHGKILANAEISLVIAFLILYTLATIFKCFLISIFFSKANVAASGGAVIFFTTYLPFSVLNRGSIYISKGLKIFFCLSSNAALGLGSKIFALWELDGSGCNWSNWNKKPGNEDLSLDTVMFMMFIDSILYASLTWYLEGVYPGNFGLPKPWNFPFSKNYWCANCKNKRLNKMKDNKKKEASISYLNETEPVNLKVGVEVQNLSKVYKNGKVAISNLTINFYQNHITAFLGRNGAGKTTTISILTGLFPPSSGSAKINGWNIESDMSTIRKSLGVCPQSNVHFRHFTVEEHLWFFARLKGHDPAQVQVETQQLLSDLNMTEKKDSLSVHLSGGMKRKLSIAMAFIGGSRTVILDEPTAGIDPFSRKGIWDLLLKYKKGRTIIMTTHNMSEAELLGDRIAIFANGQIQCYGSAVFLKSKFGWGHILTIELIGNDSQKGEGNPEVNDIISLIKNIFPEATELERFGTEIKYGLPKMSNNAEKYQQLFESLHNEKEKLGIHSFGLSDSNLEEIFLKIVDKDDEIGGKLEDIKKFEDDDDDKGFDISSLKLENNRHYWRQFKALLKKRYHHNKRNIIAVLMQLLLPVAFVYICIGISNSVPVDHPVSLLVDHVNNPNREAGFFEVQQSAKTWTAKYIEQLSNPTGLGVKCIKFNGRRDRNCKKPYKIKSKKLNNEIHCNCTDGHYECPPCSLYDIPEKIVMSSGYKMLNVTGIDVCNWIMNTWHCYKGKRFGGYSFGIDISQQRNKSLKENIADDNNLTNYSSTQESLTFNNSLLHDNIKIWFNGKWKMSPVEYLNNMNNIVLRSSLPPNISDGYGIKLYIHPINYTKKQFEYIYSLKKQEDALLHAVSLIFALSFIPASFVMYLIEERISGAKHLQCISGVNWVLYWIQAFVWDMFCYCLAILVCVVALVIFKANAYINSRNFPGFIILLFLYGWAAIPLMYPASFYFDVPSSAFVSLSCINIFLGITTTAGTHVLRVFHDEYLGKIEQILSNVLIIFPHFCLGEGILKFSEIHTVTLSMAFYNVKLDTNLFSLHALGKHNLSLFVSGIIFFLFVLLLEKYQNRGTFSEHKVSLDPPVIDDEDVLHEKNRILNNEVEDTLVLKCLTKVYPVNNHIAVNQLCLGVKRKECFGLLGLNGAGKTTTFKMLTGDLSITFGDAFILGHSVRKEISTIRHHIGYCPQYDALDSLFTPKEHLEFYCDIRNIPYEKKSKLVKTYLKKFDLMKYKDVSVLYLTGGNKRKLSAAIAVLGNTHIIFLDEPTSGMDPKGQRFLWSTIKNCVQSGRSVFLTSHSMNECEALCSRITIMVNGQFKCLGSTQHLKNKYGRGYDITVRAKEEQIGKVKREILLFPKMKEKYSFNSQITFEVETDILSLTKIFGVLENLSADSTIEDYSFSQKSLEEIFLHFVQVHTE